MASTKYEKDPRRELLEDVGYNISPDWDQPGLWTWTTPSAACGDSCDISLDSREEAVADAWKDAASQAMAILDMADEQWEALSFPDQARAIRSALTEDRPTFEPSADAGGRREVYLEIKVLAPEGMSPDTVAEILDTLINIGLSDASTTVENDEGDVEAAQAALNLHLESPRVRDPVA